MKIQKTKINYKDLFWVSIGLFLILLVIYRRLILERLPQNIIFEFSFWQIIFISWLVFIYSLRAGVFKLLYLWVLLFIEKRPHIIISKGQIYDDFISLIQKPFVILYDKFLLLKKSHFYILTFCHQNYRFFIFLKNKIGFLESYEISYIIFNLMPRTIVMLTLSYDIYNQYFNYFYKTLGLLIVPLIYQTLIKAGNKYFVNRLPLLEDKFDFIPFQDLDVFQLEMCLNDNNVFFEYHTWIDEEIKNNISYYQYGYIIYKFLLFQELYLSILKQHGWIYLQDKLINYIFAMLWWYILFHMFLEMPTIQWNFIYTTIYNLLFQIYMFI